jgi:putative DNA-binding protein
MEIVMSALRDLQASFGEYVRDGRSSAIARHFDSPIASAEAVLAIHRNNFRVTLTEALGSIFPAVRNLVGEACFAAHATRFVQRHPPSSPVLSAYGDAFPGFLDTQPSLSGVPYLADVGRLEWAWNEAFHAGDAAALTPGRLHRVVSDCRDDLELTLHPSVRLVASPYPVSLILRAARHPVLPTVGIDLVGNPEHLLIVRPDGEVTVMPVDTGTYSLLRALKDGRGFQAAAEAAREASPEFSLAGSLGSLLVRGTFASFTTHPEDPTNDEPP